MRERERDPDEADWSKEREERVESKLRKETEKTRPEN